MNQITSRFYQIIGVALCATLVTGCSKKDPKEYTDTHGVKFHYTPTEANDVVATYKNIQVTRKAITSQSPFLKELAEKESAMAFEFLVKEAATKSSGSKGGKVTLVVYLPSLVKPEAVLATIKENIRGVDIQYAKKEAAQADIIGQIGERFYKKSDMPSSTIKFTSVIQKENVEIMNLAKGSIVRSAMAAAAEKAGMSLADFLNKKVYGKAAPASQEEIAQFMKTAGMTEADLNEGVRTKINQIIEERKKNEELYTYFAKKIQDGPIQIHTQPLQLDVSFSKSMGTIWGYDDAPVTITLFSDLVCNTCIDMVKEIQALEKKYRGQLKVSFNHFFFENDRNSRMVAEASLCAYEQGAKKLKSFIEKAVDVSTAISEEVIYQTATSAGCNVENFKKCFIGRDQASLVDDHLKFSKSVGIVAQPTLLVEGEVIEGTITPEALEKMVADKVQTKGDAFYKVWWRRIKGLF